MVAATVSRAFASSLGIMAACLMAGLLGVIAVSGRWPVDAPRTHVEGGGILSLAPERVSRVEFSSGGQRAVFSRNSRKGWLFDDAPTELAVSMARAANLTLVALARADSLLLFNDPFEAVAKRLKS